MFRSLEANSAVSHRSQIELFRLPGPHPIQRIDLQLPSNTASWVPRVCFNQNLTLLAIDDTIYGPLQDTEAMESKALPLTNRCCDTKDDQETPSSRINLVPQFSACSRYVVYSDTGLPQTSQPPRLEVYRIAADAVLRVDLPVSLKLDTLYYAKFLMHPTLPLLAVVSWSILRQETNHIVTLCCSILDLDDSRSWIDAGETASNSEGKVLQ